MFHYLDAIADNDIIEQKRGMSHRIIRALIEIYDIQSKENLKIYHKSLETNMQVSESSYIKLL